MTLKLSHKFLIANIGIILTLTCIFLSLSYITNKSLLSNAMNGVDIKVMEALSVILRDAYKESGGWQGYTSDKELWNKTVNSTFFNIFFSLPKNTNSEQIKKYTPPTTSSETTRPSENKPCTPSFGTFLQRLSLLDANKKELLTAEISKQDVNYQVIKIDGKIIGWLRVGKINVDVIPLAEHFFNQQLYLSSWASILGAIVAVFLSYLLARHITSPIKELTAYAHQIAKRNFESTININTQDELQDLAISFNTISKELNLYDTRQKQWLMDISHELRTPITILMGEISAICDNLTKCDTDAIASLQEEVLQIKHLVDDLDDISKLDQAGLKLDLQNLDLIQLLSYHHQRYLNKFSAKGIHLHTNFTHTSIVVIGDIDRIAQVIINLFENSLRYSESPGSIWLNVIKKDNLAIFEIEDSGPGVPEESISKIFDRLYRVDTSRNRMTGGSGLGLSICKQIIHAHKGEITAKHSEKGGLCIRTTLPLEDDPRV